MSVPSLSSWVDKATGRDYCLQRGGFCMRAENEVDDTYESEGLRSCDDERDDLICTCSLGETVPPSMVPNTVAHGQQQ